MTQKLMFNPSLLSAEYSARSVLNFAREAEDFKPYISKRYYDFVMDPGEDLESLYVLYDQNRADFSGQKNRHPFYKFYVGKANPEPLYRIQEEVEEVLSENHLRIFDPTESDTPTPFPEYMESVETFRDNLVSSLDHYIPKESLYQGTAREEIEVIADIMHEEIAFSMTHSPILHRVKKVVNKFKQAGISTFELSEEYAESIKEYMDEKRTELSEDHPEGMEKLRRLIETKQRVSNIPGISWVITFVGWAISMTAPIFSKPYDIITQMVLDP